MESTTFHKWLAERGCRFDTDQEKRGTGHANVTVHRAGGERRWCRWAARTKFLMLASFAVRVKNWVSTDPSCRDQRVGCEAR
jgi:hypothetical protein